MIIEPITGMKKQKELISEKEFSSFSIFSTAKIIKEYFTKYGYHFIGFYHDTDTIVVKDNNWEEMIATADFDVYHALNYRTGDTVASRLNVAEALSYSHTIDKISSLCFTHTIASSNRGMKLIEKTTSNTILEAEEMRFIDKDKVWVSTYGLEGIYSLTENTYYPFLKRDTIVYIGAHPEEFVDVRTGLYVTFQNIIQSLSLATPNLLELVAQYPYGEKKGNKFHLLSNPLKYGIFYKNGDFSQINWYPSEKERDSILDALGILVETTLSKEYVKLKKD